MDRAAGNPNGAGCAQQRQLVMFLMLPEHIAWNWGPVVTLHRMIGATPTSPGGEYNLQ